MSVTSTSVSGAVERSHRSTLPGPAITVVFDNGALSNASALPSGRTRQSKFGCAAQMSDVLPWKSVAGFAVGS